MASEAKTIRAKDLSEIDVDNKSNSAKSALMEMLQNQWQWLDSVMLNERIDRNEPIISLDQYSGKIRAGRFIGRVDITDNFVLDISPKEPDFFEGMLEGIYGIKFIQSPSDLGQEGFYNWHLIRTIFYGRLLKSHTKSLPLVRKKDVVVGRYLLGKLNVARTARSLARKQAVSEREIRVISPPIAYLITAASKVLDIHCENPKYRKKSNQTIDLQQRKISKVVFEFSEACKSYSIKECNSQIRYTALSLSYKNVVELARQILNLGASNTEGTKEGLSVLFDISEIWEQFCYRFLKREFQDCEIINCANTAVGSLDKSELFKLKPDFLIKRYGKIVAVVDAKYKVTNNNMNRVAGTTREDMYQMSAYLNSYLGAPWRDESNKKLLLLYPAFSGRESSINQGNAILHTSEHGHTIQRCLIDKNMRNILSE